MINQPQTTLQCEVLLFAQLREAVGTHTVALDLPKGCTVQDAIERLARHHPAIAAMRDRLAVAVNETYQPRNAVIPDGCTIALIPPVSGG